MKILVFLGIIFINLLDSGSSNIIDSIRIFADYTTLDAQKIRFGTEFVNNVKKIIDSAVEALRTIIMVPQYENNLVVKFCDKSIQTDITVMTSGIPVDFVLFPYIIDSSVIEFKNVDIYGLHCLNDQRTGRPLAGILGINENINITKTNWKEYYQTQVINIYIKYIYSYNFTLRYYTH